MLSNAYFLAKFRFDTAENEPAKNLQNFLKCIFEKCIFEKMHFRKMLFREVRSAVARRYCLGLLPYGAGMALAGVWLFAIYESISSTVIGDRNVFERL